MRNPSPPLPPVPSKSHRLLHSRTAAKAYQPPGECHRSGRHTDYCASHASCQSAHEERSSSPERQRRWHALISPVDYFYVGYTCGHPHIWPNSRELTENLCTNQGPRRTVLQYSCRPPARPLAMQVHVTFTRFSRFSLLPDSVSATALTRALKS